MIVVNIILAYVLIIANVVISFRDECAFFQHNITPCAPPKLAIPYIAYKPELINFNNLKYPHGTVAMLVCPANYYLEAEGSHWRICKNGAWSGPFGRCKPLGT